MSFGDSLTKIRIEKGFSRKDLAEQLEIPYTTLRNYETDQREPGHKLLIKIANLLSVSVDELVGYQAKKENAPLYSSEALRLAGDYDRQMDKRGRETVRGVADLEVARFKAETAAELRESREQMEASTEITPDVVEMLVYINPAAAGTPLYAESDFKRLKFPRDKVPQNADFGIRISGKSMEPTVMDGSIVWVHKKLDFPNGTVAVFMLNDSSVCKRFFKEADGTVMLKSDNPDHKDVLVREFDTFIPVGEVVGAI